MLSTVIKRPVTIIMFFIAVFIVGVISFDRLPLELKPNTEYPRLIVYASWRNASPETIESKVTAPIESEISSLANIYKITSYSQVGRCYITVEYLRDTDMNYAYMDLNEKIYTIKQELPEDVRNSVGIRKYVPREDRDTETLLVYKIFGEMKLYEVYQFAEDNLQNKLGSINGVSTVELSGASGREVKVLLDRDKMKLYNINPYNVIQKLYEYGNTSDAGVVKQSDREYNLEVNNKFESIAQLKDIYITHIGKVPVRLLDIAEIKDALGDDMTLNRINGVSTVTLEIVKESGANAIDTADGVKERINELKEDFPANINIELDSDSTEEMRDQLSDVRSRAIFSVIIITLVLLFFLRDVKTPFIIMLTIFFSVLITIIMLYFGGHTINLITISGLALGLGLLVDNSIVVIENIYQYYKNGYEKFQATLKGTKEVMLPIFASTLTTCVVFLPFLYLTGEKRLYWMPLAVSVSLSLLSSLVVSFTFTPTITHLMLKKRPDSERVITPEDMEIKENFFHTLLKVFINNSVMVIIFVGFLFYMSYFLFDKYVDKGSIFNWNRDDGVSVYISMPVGSTLEMTDGIISKFEKRVREVGGYEKFTTYVSDDFANIFVTYTDEDLKTLKPFKMEEELVAMAVNFQGPFISVYNTLNSSSSYRAGGTTPKSYSGNVTVRGYNYEDLKKNSETLKEYLLSNSRISDVDINGTANWWRSTDLFNFVFEINREKLSRYNTTVQMVMNFIRSNISGTYPYRMLIGGQETPYTVKYSDYKDFNVTQMKDLIFTFGFKSFRLQDIGKIVKEPVMSEIVKEDQAYTRIVKYDYRGTQKSASKFKDHLIENYYMPPGYSFVEEERDYMTEEDTEEILLILLISVALVFMVTAALFESFAHPFIVILTVPLGLIGVFLVFFFMDESFNREAYMGAIILAGIVVNNSIILINHINDLRKQGLTAYKAIIIGTTQRVRPILMTTTTTVIGILPLVVNSEKSENFWYSLSITTMGGLIASTIFVLTVIPVLYVSVERVKNKVKNVVVKIAT